MITLEVFGQNAAARAVYQRLGYQEQTFKLAKPLLMSAGRCARAKARAGFSAFAELPYRRIRAARAGEVCFEPNVVSRPVVWAMKNQRLMTPRKALRSSPKSHRPISHSA